MFYLKYIQKKRDNIFRRKLWYLKKSKKINSKKINKNYNSNYFSLTSVANSLDKKFYLTNISIVDHNFSVKLLIFKFNKD